MFGFLYPRPLLKLETEWAAYLYGWEARSLRPYGCNDLNHVVFLLGRALQITIGESY